MCGNVRASKTVSMAVLKCDSVLFLLTAVFHTHVRCANLSSQKSCLDDRLYLPLTRGKQSWNLGARCLQHVTTFEIMHGAPKDPVYVNQRTFSIHFMVDLRCSSFLKILCVYFVTLFDDTSHLLVLHMLPNTFAVFEFVPTE